MWCLACRLVAHVCCIEYLVEEKELTCKPTFRNARQRLKEVMYTLYSVCMDRLAQI